MPVNLINRFRISKALICLSLGLIVAVSANAAFIYDPANGTLTDGTVTLSATLANENELTVDASGGRFNNDSAPETFSIDFTDVHAADNKRYQVVEFKNFSYSGANYFKTHASKLTAFIAPGCKKLSGNGCFAECSNLTKVELSSEFAAFADRSFMNCARLVDFYPTTILVKKINISCFSGCASLKGGFSFTDCTSLGNGTFSGCELLDNISLPKVTSLSASSFSGCANLKTLEISDDVSFLGTSAFSGCSSLSGDFFRKMLDEDITQLGDGSYDTGYKSVFTGCALLDRVEWNFPEMSVDKKGNDVNIVGLGLFQNCTKLSRVDFKTPVKEIRGSAFAEIAPGAELYMQPNPPEVFAACAVGNKTGPYPKVYLNDNYDAWLAKIEENHYVIRKEDFNNWSGEYSGVVRTWADVATKLRSDAVMCAVADDDSVRLKTRGVLAFVIKKSIDRNLNSVYGFWVMKVPQKALLYSVR